VRVPTWAPFRLQVYFNGHHWLAHHLEDRGIGFQLADNAFLHIDDSPAAQRIADALDVAPLQQALDRFAAVFCPAARAFHCRYQWTLMQVEYATDIVFKSPQDLADLYQAIIRTAVHAVKVDDVAGFLGRKLTANYRGEIGTDFKTRIYGPAPALVPPLARASGSGGERQLQAGRCRLGSGLGPSPFAPVTRVTIPRSARRPGCSGGWSRSLSHAGCIDDEQASLAHHE
jgi:hypothetical protein